MGRIFSASNVSTATVFPSKAMNSTSLLRIPLMAKPLAHFPLKVLDNHPPTYIMSDLGRDFKNGPLIAYT